MACSNCVEVQQKYPDNRCAFDDDGKFRADNFRCGAIYMLCAVTELNDDEDDEPVEGSSVLHLGGERYRVRVPTTAAMEERSNPIEALATIDESQVDGFVELVVRGRFYPYVCEQASVTRNSGTRPLSLAEAEALVNCHWFSLR